MRNLKRALALVMATAMLLSMMVIGAGASDFTDADEIENTEAVETLVTLGVIAGRDTGAFDPTGTVTRAEMAKMITVSLNGGSDPILGSGASTTTFTDTTGHWAESYIAYCANLGIINGYGDGTFGPDDTVTGTAAAKMILTALGYDATIEGYTGTGWDLNVDTKANAVGLYDGFESVSVSAGLSRDYAAQLIYNGVQADVVEYQQSTYNSDLYYIEAQGSMLYVNFGVVRVEGVVVANEYIDTLDSTVLAEGRTTLALVETSDDHKYDDNAYNTFYLSTGAEEIGRTVIIYVKPSSTANSTASAATVVGEAVIADSNVVVESTDKDELDDIAGKLTIDVDGSTVDAYGAFTYEDTVVYYNGDLDSTDWTDVKLPVGASVVMVDNDDDGDVDYAFITQYTFGEVTTYNTSDEEIYIEGMGTSDKYDFDDVYGVEDVAQKDLVNFVIIDGKMYVELAEIITGEMTKYGSDYLTVDGASYTYSDDTTSYANSIYNTDLSRPSAIANLDEDIIVYLDVLGYAVAVETTTLNDYALILAANDVGLLGTDYQAKVLLSDGTTNTYTIAAYYASDVKQTLSGFDSTAWANLAGMLCTYSLSGDEITLYAETGNNVGNGVTVDIEKNKVSMDVNGSCYADDETVFFYVTMESAVSGTVRTAMKNGSIDSTSVAVGYENVASLTTTAAAYTYTASGSAVDVVVVVTNAATTAGDWYYVVEYIGTTSDGYEVLAMLDGELEYITVSAVAGAIEGTTYSYTINSKGAYVGTELGTVVSGNVTYVGSKSILVENYAGAVQEYFYDSSTAIYEIDSDDTAETAIVKGDYVTVVYDNSTDRESYAILVEEPFSSSNAAVLEVDGTTVAWNTTDSDVDLDVSASATGNGLASLMVISSGASYVVYDSYDEAATSGTGLSGAVTASALSTGSGDTTIGGDDGSGDYYYLVVTSQSTNDSTMYVIEVS